MGLCGWSIAEESIAVHVEAVSVVVAGPAAQTVIRSEVVQVFPRTGGG